VTYKIIVQTRARRAFLALDKPIRKRISAVIDALAADPRPQGAKALTGDDWRPARPGG
jgi:mRNA-degrading endonuclease RelE of RelBE toxin-antitoxin system